MVGEANAVRIRTAVLARLTHRALVERVFGPAADTPSTGKPKQTIALQLLWGR